MSNRPPFASSPMAGAASMLQMQDTSNSSYQTMRRHDANVPSYEQSPSRNSGVRSSPLHVAPSTDMQTLMQRLAEAEEDKEIALDSMSEELEEIQNSLDQSKTQLQQTQEMLQDWQELGHMIKDDLLVLKGERPPMFRPTPAAQMNTKVIHADLRLVFQALESHKTELDNKDKDLQGASAAIATMTSDMTQMRDELHQVKGELVAGKQQAMSMDAANQMDNLRSRCEFFKSNSEKRTQEVQALQREREQLEYQNRATNLQLRELESILEGLGYGTDFGSRSQR